MNKYKVGDNLKSNFTGYGITYGKEYTVQASKYNVHGCVLIRDDSGYVGFYKEDYFELV